MKFLVVLSVAIACVSADVSHLHHHSHGSDYSAPIVRSDYQISPDGSYQWAYETGNGIVAQADGVLTNPNSEHASIAVRGSFKYVSPEGVPVEVGYVADEQGYQPQGNVLPTPPPVPVLIQRSLDYIAAHPSAERRGVSGISSLLGK